MEWKECILRERTHGTLLGPSMVRDRVGIKAATDVLADMQEQLSSVDGSLPWTRVRRLLCSVPLDELQIFWTLVVDQGRDGYVLEPGWAAQYRSPASWAAKGCEKTPGGTSRGMAHVIRPGLGPEEHMRQALQWPSSFGEMDLPIWMSCLQHGPWRSWGLPLHAWRHGQLRAITTLSQAVEPLQRALVRGASVDVRERAEKWEIAFIVAIIPLHRWPDRKLAVCFTEGFRTIGRIEPPSVFRPLAEPTEPVNGSIARFPGDAAVQFVVHYGSRPQPRDAELVTKLVCQEEMKGHQSQSIERAGPTAGVPCRCLPSIRTTRKGLLLTGGRSGRHSDVATHDNSLSMPDWCAATLETGEGEKQQLQHLTKLHATTYDFKFYN